MKSTKELRRLITFGGVTLKDLTGFTYEELKSREFKDIEKYLKSSGKYYGKTSWDYRYKMTEEEMTAFIAGVVEAELDELAYEEENKDSERKLVQMYLKSIEWLASQISDENGKNVLRRAWKEINKNGLNQFKNGLFKVEGLRPGEFFNADALKESLKLKGKRIEDFDI